MSPKVLIWSSQLLISFIFFLCSTDSSRKLVDQGASKDGALNNFALIVILILSKKFGLRYLREFWSDGTTKIKMFIDKKKNVHPQKGKCLSIEKLFPRNANEWTHLVGIRLSPRRLGSRRSDQSYASNQHRRGNGFNHRHLSDLQFCTYSLNKAIIPQPENGHQSSAPVANWSNWVPCHIQEPGPTPPVSRYLSANMLLHLCLMFQTFPITEGIYFWSSQRGNDETSLRFSPSFHGPYNLCGSCRQWFA